MSGQLKSKIALFVVAFAVWCLLNWVPDWQHLVVGVFVALFVTYMTSDLFAPRSRLVGQPMRVWYFIAHYIPALAWECLKANIDVAYRVIHPDLRSTRNQPSLVSEGAPSTASDTRTRHMAEGMFGTVHGSLPSLGVLVL